MSYQQTREESRLAHLRRQIALDAARLISEQGIRDYQHAKRKAARKLGVYRQSQLPRNIEINDALIEYQRLFSAGEQSRLLLELRAAASEAMAFFAVFRPRLVGAVLEGTADRHSAVCLHLFADTPEEIKLFLDEQRIPYNETQRRLRFAGSGETFKPVFQFQAGDAVMDLTVFATVELKEAPLSQTDGKPMRRANRAAVEALLQARTQL